MNHIGWIVRNAVSALRRRRPSWFSRARRWIARKIAGKGDAIDQRIAQMRKNGGPNS